MSSEIRIAHLFISPGHNFVGHHGLPPGQHETIEVHAVECLAGRGLLGDRYLDHQESYKGQITFFALETYEKLCAQLGVTDKGPGAFRRNAITVGADLNQLVGQRFTIQGLVFEGTEPCRPCHWMNGAFHPEAEAALQGQGGLRAIIHTGGVLRVDAGRVP